MKRLAVLLILFAMPSFAQQPSEDGKAAIYKQLLARSQDELAQTGAMLQSAQIENAQLKAERDKLKADAPKQP